MQSLTLEIFLNTSNEVAAAYVTGAIGLVFGIFQLIGKERERKKNQGNAIELEKIKQRSELYMSLRKDKISYNGELLNEVYKLRVANDEAIERPELEKFKFLAASLKDFAWYYRGNANKINYLVSDTDEVRSYGHDILAIQDRLVGIMKMLENEGMNERNKQYIENICLKLQKICKEYEEFLRNAATKEYKDLSDN